MSNCKKCNKEFEPKKGLKHYCSLICRNSRVWSVDDKIKKSIAAKNSEKVQKENKSRIGIISKKRINTVSTPCIICSKLIYHKENKIRKYHKSCWLLNSGGYRKGSGIGKSGWYKGFWCDSSYELAWVIYNLENNIPFERNTKKFKYIFKGKEYKYIPDFIQDGYYVEIKNYMTPQVEAKIKSISNIKILFKKDLKSEFDYVEKKYGKNFIKLYSK